MKIKRGFIPWGSGKEGGFFSGPQSYSRRNCEYLPCYGWVVLCGVGVTPFGKLMDLPLEWNFASHSLYD